MPLFLAVKEEIMMKEMLLFSVLGSIPCPVYQHRFLIPQQQLIIKPILFYVVSFQGLTIILGSLSKGVFERRTATGNETFSLFTRLGATTFVKLCVFTLIETIDLKIRAHPLCKSEKCPLLFALRRSKTPLFKLPNIKLEQCPDLYPLAGV